jgi:hypothetical protein
MFSQQYMASFYRCFLICGLMTLARIGYCQKDTSYDNYLNNQVIQYKVIFTTHNVVHKKSDLASRYRIKLDMPESLIAYFKTKDSAFWIHHLMDTTSDWATNLVLYYLTKRDAAAFSALYRNRSGWLPYKKAEIEAWQSGLTRAPQYLIAGWRFAISHRSKQNNP